MGDSVEALGGLVDAGLAAKALGGNGAGATSINAAEIAGSRHECANCSSPLVGEFCANCGQKAHLHRSLADVGHEFLHGITHFDGKAWKTLPMLLFRPGKLTRDYIMGHRARYIAPVPLFLLVVFLMFFVFSFVRITPNQAEVAATASVGRADAAKAVAETTAEIADLDRRIAAAEKIGNSVEIKTLKGVRVGLVTTRGRLEARAEGKDPETMVNNAQDLSAFIGNEVKSGDLDVNLGNDTLNVKVRKALKNPELVLYKIQGKAYKLSFLLVPLSLPWLWLMFAWKREVRMYDHAIFALYSISFMSLLFVVGSIALSLNFTWGIFWFLLVLVAPVAHMFAQLKGAYALGNFSAAWRTFGLLIASVMTLGIYAALMIVLGVVD